MLSKGSGFEDTEEITVLSENPKDEAACGLVMDGTKLKGLGRKFKDPKKQSALHVQLINQLTLCMAR